MFRNKFNKKGIKLIQRKLKTLLKDTKADLIKQMIKCPLFLNRMIQHHKNVNLLKLIYKISAILIKILISCFIESDKLILRFI